MFQEEDIYVVLVIILNPLVFWPAFALSIPSLLLNFDELKKLLYAREEKKTDYLCIRINQGHNT